MVEHLGVTRRIVLHHDVHVREIQAASSHIRAQQYIHASVRYASLVTLSLLAVGMRKCRERSRAPLRRLLAVQRKEA